MMRRKIKRVKGREEEKEETGLHKRERKVDEKEKGG